MVLKHHGQVEQMVELLLINLYHMLKMLYPLVVLIHLLIFTLLPTYLLILQVDAIWF